MGDRVSTGAADRCPQNPIRGITPLWEAQANRGAGLPRPRARPQRLHRLNGREAAQVLLLGLEAVRGEWSLVTMVWNVRRMAVLKGWAPRTKHKLTESVIRPEVGLDFAHTASAGVRRI